MGLLGLTSVALVFVVVAEADFLQKIGLMNQQVSSLSALGLIFSRPVIYHSLQRPFALIVAWSSRSLRSLRTNNKLSNNHWHMR
jgi:hypothetical protein